MKITWLERKLSMQGEIPEPSSLGPAAFGFTGEQVKDIEVGDDFGFWGFSEIGVSASPSELEFQYIASRHDPTPLGRSAHNVIALCESIEAVAIEFTFDAFPPDGERVSAFAFDLIPQDFTEAIFNEPAAPIGVWYNVHYEERHRAVSAHGVIVESRSALRMTVIERVRVDSSTTAKRAVTPAALKRLSKFCVETSESILTWYKEHSE